MLNDYVAIIITTAPVVMFVYMLISGYIESSTHIVRVLMKRLNCLPMTVRYKNKDIEISYERTSVDVSNMPNTETSVYITVFYINNIPALQCVNIYGEKIHFEVNFEYDSSDVFPILKLVKMPKEEKKQLHASKEKKNYF